jgi:hypothetical protein
VVERCIDKICTTQDIAGSSLDPLQVIFNELGPSIEKLKNSQNETISLYLAPENYNPDISRDRNMSVIEAPNAIDGMGFVSRRLSPKEQIETQLVSTLAMFTFSDELLAAKEKEPCTLRQALNTALQELQETLADPHTVQAFKQLRKVHNTCFFVERDVVLFCTRV